MATAETANSKPQIPDGWQLVRLGDVAEVVGGSTPSRTRDEFWGGEVPWVVPSELTSLKSLSHEVGERCKPSQ